MSRAWLLAALAALAAVSLVPAIDLTVAGWFWDPAREAFPFRSHPLGEWVRKGMPAWLFALAGGVALLGLAGEVRRRPLLGVTRRVGGYLLLALALGPGLVVNLVLKDNWGRARPSTLERFGGPNHYTPPWLPSGQCDDNCSFSSGHAALAFWLVAFALLAPPAWRGRALAAAMAFGGLVGLARIAQGGHFVSDVAWSAAIVAGVAALLFRLMVEPERRGGQKNIGGDGLESR